MTNRYKQLFLQLLPFPAVVNTNCLYLLNIDCEPLAADGKSAKFRKSTDRAEPTCAITDMVCDSCVFPHPDELSPVALSFM